jgi:MFS family permease
MVPVFSLLSGRLIARVGAGAVALAGCLTLAAAALVMIERVGATPHYATGLLPGTLLTGVAVGLALPTLMGVGSSALPTARFATGSGVLSMGRQLGFTLGVSVLIAVLGNPARGQAQLVAFHHGWIAVGVISVAAAFIALFLARPAGATSPVTKLAGSKVEQPRLEQRAQPDV